MSGVVRERFDYWPLPPAVIAGGTGTEETARQRNGIACAKYAAGGVKTNSINFPTALDHTYYYRAAFRLPTFPGSTNALWRLNDKTGTLVELSVTSAGLLELWNPVAAAHPSGTKTISLDTWVVVEFQFFVPTVGNGTLNWRVNDVAVGSESNMTWRNLGVFQATVGNISGGTAEVLVDDFGVNSDIGTIENSWLTSSYPLVRAWQPVGCYQGALMDGDVYSVGQSDAPFNPSTWNSFDADQGRKAGIVHWQDSENGWKWEANPTQTCYSRGAIPLKTLGGGEGICAKVLAGEWDTKIKEWAEGAAAFKHPFFARLWWEMNGNWWKWSTSATQYIEAWKYVYNKVKPIAPNVTFVWCPNVNVGELSVVADFGAYYPGDEYVDWTGLDGYSGENVLKKFGWRTPAVLYKPSYDRMREIAPTKPMIICEIGCSEFGGSKATWITELLGTAIPSLMPAIRGLVWFNWNITEGAGRLDWPIESSGTAEAAYKAGIGSSYYIGPIEQTFADLQPVPGPGEALYAEPPPIPQINVQAITAGGEGLAYNLTDDISGLQFSNVSPGGDETCSFTLHRPWHARNPEIDKGNILRVTDGIDVLWQGRVEEAERQTAEDETIDVTAYGLGARLKDTTFKEIFIDRELTHWNAIPNPRIAALGGNFKTAAGSFEVRPNSTGQPILALIFTRVANAGAVRGVIEAWYDASGIELGSVAYNQKSYDQGGGGYVGLLTSWIGRLNFWTTDAGGGEQTGPSIAAEPSSSSSLTATEAGKVYSSILLLFNAELAGTDGEWRFEFGPLVVFGRHGLTVQGTVPETAGFKVSQLVQNIASRAEGITTRVIAETSYIVKQSTFLTPTTLEDGINNVNQFENDQRTWGTWGPSSSLDNTTRGYFDYNEVDTEPSWYIPRERCDSLDLHSETATLFNRVQVTYTDVSGASKVVVRTAYVEDLAKMGVTRTFVLDAGASTEEDAQNLGDAFLALTGNFSPARGSVSITRPIKHKFRGMLKPHYMRADGSAIKMPDILPFQTLFTLDSTPDRRTIFPIKRVSVDCSERARPVVSIDVDQTNDALSAMQARLGLFTSLLDA